MLYHTWLGVVGVGVLLTILGLRGTGVAYAALGSSAAYALATVTARNVTRYFQDGSSAVVDNGPGVQLLLLAASILSLTMLVLWFAGEYRPAESEEPRQDAEDPVQDGFGPGDSVGGGR